MRINFVGDIGLFRRFEELSIDPFGVIELPASDLNIGNFEFIVPRSRKPFFYDVQEQYSCNYKYLDNLKLSNFHGFGLANNHSLDYDLEGANDTIDYLKGRGIEVFGFSDSKDFAIGEFSHEGIKLAIIACVKKGRWSKSNFGYGPDEYEPEEIVKCIRTLKPNFDHIIVFPHWGTELIEVPDLQDTIYAKGIIDAGATAVIGHHPHISQGIEKYKHGLIAYSLGSFIYVHEEELGYSERNVNRHYSICLNLDLSKQGITSFEAHYYEYNRERKIPELCNGETISKYADFLNSSIYDQKVYKQQLFKTLIRREIKSFWKRFKAKPFKTVVQYIKTLSPKHIKKIIS